MRRCLLAYPYLHRASSAVVRQPDNLVRCAELPIRFAFINTLLELQGATHLAYSQFDVIVDVLMLLDFILKFARAYYEYDYHGQQHLRVKPSEIARKYLKTSMIRDSFACLPLDTFVILAGHPQTASAVRLLRLLRMERVAKFKKTVDAYVDRSVGRGWLRPVVSGLSLVLGTMFFNHVLACVLYKVGSELYDDPGCADYEGNRCGWVTRMEYKEETGVLPRYADAFYFTFTILTTVGFGDITAHSTMERMMTVVAMTAGCAIFGIVMGQITAVIHGMNMGLAHYEERVRELEQYMQFRGVKHEVRTRVKRYIVEKFPEKRLYDERAILNSLPMGLRTEFQMDMYMEHVVALPFLPDDDHEVLVRICQIIRQDVIMPGEIVVREGSKLQHFFTVVSGKITVQVPFLNEARAAKVRPASWMLADEELLQRNIQWSKMDEEEKAKAEFAVQQAHQDQISEKMVVIEGTKLRAQRIRKQKNIDIVPEEDDDEAGWLTLAVLKDSHYFCEQCLSYDAPSLKRYIAKHISTIGVIDKDGCAHLISDYPSMRNSVREYMLVKFRKICSRITRHVNGERKLPPAALLDSRFEANMMCKVIDAWGGAREITKAAHQARSASYIGVIEQTYSAFKPASIHVNLNNLNSATEMRVNQKQQQVHPCLPLCVSPCYPRRSIRCECTV